MNMNSTPTRHKPSASKLPIKRKTPDPILIQPDPKPPPFKFHRIWTEPDEIRFLQGLLDCSSDNLSFPRDLGIFYGRFSNSMAQPYTNSQLSEKLRRLRKKFRIISTRLSKGLDPSQLSLHDRALYDLSKRLWHSDFAAISPFNGARNVGNVNFGSNVGEGEMPSLFGVKLEFSPTLLVIDDREDDDRGVNLEVDFVDDVIKVEDNSNENDGEFELSEVKVEFEGEKSIDNLGGGDGVEENVDGDGVEENVDGKIGKVAGKVVMDVFEKCLTEARRRVQGDGDKRESVRVRWVQQRIAEFDALGNRLRLVLEHSLRKCNAK